MLVASDQRQNNHKAISEQLLREIRAATKDVHLRLHNHPLTGTLAEPGLTRERYILVLMGFERFYQGVGSDFSTLNASFQPGDSAGLLKADLASLACPLNPLPACPRLQLPSSMDSYLGMMYVLEGSRLGGQVIAKNVYDTLGYTCENGASFFIGYGKDTGKRWRDFLRYFSDCAENPAPIVEAACATFNHLERWLWQVNETKVVHENI